MLMIGPATFVSILIEVYFYGKMLFTHAKVGIDNIYIIPFFTPVFSWLLFSYLGSMETLKLESNSRLMMIFMTVILNFVFYRILKYFKPKYDLTKIKNRNQSDPLPQIFFLLTIILVFSLFFAVKPKNLDFCQAKCQHISGMIGDINYVYGMHYLISVLIGLFAFIITRQLSAVLKDRSY